MSDHRPVLWLMLSSFLFLPVAGAQAAEFADRPRRISRRLRSLAARRAQLREAIEQEWQYELKTSPEFATAIGDSRYNDRLDDRSAAAAERDIAACAPGDSHL